MTNAIIGIGTKLQLGDGVSPTEAFTTVAEVLSITGPSLSTASIDATSMDSTGKFMEFIPGLRDAGELSFDIQYIFNNATHGILTGILQDFNNNETKTRNWKILFPDTGVTTWNLAGFVTEFTLNDPVEDKVTATMTIKLTGKPTLA